MSEPSEEKGLLFVSYQAFIFVQLKRENIGEGSTQNNNNKGSNRCISVMDESESNSDSNRSLCKLQILLFPGIHNS